MALGGSTSASPFFLDVSANSLRLGTGTTANAVLNMYSSNGATGSITYTTNDSWNFEGGSVGLGVANPTASLAIQAGTASAGTAPLKFAAGTNLTAPEAGALEWDGARLYITQTTGPTRKTLAYADDSQYAGFVIPDPGYTDNGDGSITIPDHEVYFYPNGVFDSKLTKYTLTGGTTGVELPALTNNATSYIVAYWNGGSPILTIVTDKSLIDYQQYIPHVTIYRSGNNLHHQNWGLDNSAVAERLEHRFTATEQYSRESGLEILTRNNAGTPEFQVEAGVMWTGAQRYVLGQQAYDSSSFFSRHVSGSWTTSYRSGNTDINNTQFDDGTDLQTLTDGYYTINYIYRGVEEQQHVYLVLGDREYEWQELALASHDTVTLPEIISSHAVLVGRIIMQKDATTGVVQSAFQDTFQTDTLISNHSLLSNLGVDDHQQYALLAGRINGQLLIGGTADNDDLIFRTTSNGAAISGADMIFQTGNNGGTEAMRILYDGTVNIKSKLGILESTGATYHTFLQGGDQGGDITYTLPTTS
ncbi:hypothetical protein EPO05_02235, partial [Patescibacteria group bacterium]